MSFYGHRLSINYDNLHSAANEVRVGAGADARMAHHVFFFGATGMVPPGSWCPTQTAYSAY